MRRTSRPNRAGFTLVELMMVIAIIAVLVGLIVPAVFYAMTSIKKRAIAIEVSGLAQAVEAYKNKYGDYPPDGSNTTRFERHYRKLFPQIAATEFTILYSVANPSNGSAAVMDPPEALVFALGGFSKDAIHPFTGPGGPITTVPGTSPVTYQYNVERTEPIYEFNAGQLSITTGGTSTLSSDETDMSYGTADAMPVYHPKGLTAPFVYFDSNTYSYVVSGATFFNNYSPAGAFGYCRPYKSTQTNTSIQNTPPNAEAFYKYMDDRKFQIISAGLDDNYGGAAMTGNGPVLYMFPTGQSLDYSGWNASTAPAVGGFTRYKDSDPPMNYQLDNAASFAEGPLSDSLPN